VVVAQVSLITQDVDEQVISVFKVIVNEGYVPDTKLHDIAMLQVHIVSNIWKSHLHISYSLI
jgi:hypothetical protein